MSKEGNCQRYFAISKKMPKDVKRHCGMCRQHGMLVETRGHHCSWINCSCSRCLLIRQRRHIMRTQIRLRRAQDKIFQRTSEPTKATIIPQNCSEEAVSTMYTSGNTKVASAAIKNQCYICQKCKNHGILVWKKEHKRHCLYANCTCDQCELIESRRKLDQILKCSSKFKQNSQRQIDVPAAVNIPTSANFLSVLSNLNRQLEHHQNDANMPSIPDLNLTAYELLKTRLQFPTTNDLEISTAGGFSKPTIATPNRPLFPIPLKPQPILFPNTVTNAPTVHGLCSPAGALMNTLAAMQFTLGIY